MAVTGQRMIGIPIVLLHEGEGLILTVETRAGWTYRGYCDVTKDNFNMKLVQVLATDDQGRQYHMAQVCLRGSMIRYVIFPDILRYSPMFKRVELRKKGVVVAGGLGRGRQQAIAAKVQKRTVEAARNMRGRGRGALPPQGRGRATGPPGRAPPAPSSATGGGYGQQSAPSYGGGGRGGYGSYQQPLPPQQSYMQQQQQQQPQQQPPPSRYQPPPQGQQQQQQGGGVGRGRGATVPHWAQ